MILWNSAKDDIISIDRDSSYLKFNLDRWGGECKLGLDIPVPTAKAIKEESNKLVTYTSTDMDVLFEKKQPEWVDTKWQNEHGGSILGTDAGSKQDEESWLRSCISILKFVTSVKSAL